MAVFAPPQGLNLGANAEPQYRPWLFGAVRDVRSDRIIDWLAVPLFSRIRMASARPLGPSNGVVIGNPINDDTAFFCGAGAATTPQLSSRTLSSGQTKRS